MQLWKITSSYLASKIITGFSFHANVIAPLKRGAGLPNPDFPGKLHLLSGGGPMTGCSGFGLVSWSAIDQVAEEAQLVVRPSCCSTPSTVPCQTH